MKSKLSLTMLEPLIRKKLFMVAFDDKIQK